MWLIGLVMRLLKEQYMHLSSLARNYCFYAQSSPKTYLSRENKLKEVRRIKHRNAVYKAAFTRFGWLCP